MENGILDNVGKLVQMRQLFLFSRGRDYASRGFRSISRRGVDRFSSFLLRWTAHDTPIIYAARGPVVQPMRPELGLKSREIWENSRLSLFKVRGGPYFFAGFGNPASNLVVRTQKLGKGIGYSIIPHTLIVRA